MTIRGPSQEHLAQGCPTPVASPALASGTGIIVGLRVRFRCSNAEHYETFWTHSEVGGAPYTERVAEREQFVERDLRGARFVECDLSDVVMRGVEIAGMDIDAPWLSEGPGLRVNGVDVTALVEQELDRRFPGRSERRAESPAGLREAWTTVDQAWDAAIERAAAPPAGSVDVRIDDEWSFAETLRHLVHAIDVWLGKGVLGLEEADFHPLGLGHGSSVSEPRPYDDVLAARATGPMVRDFVATVTDDVLDEERRNPHNPRTPRPCAGACKSSS